MSKEDYEIPEVFRRAMEDAGWQTSGGDPGQQGPRRPLPQPDQPSSFNRWLILIALLLLGLFSIGSLATFYTDFLWFEHLGFQEIFSRQLTTRVIIFAIAFAIAALILLGNWIVARRSAIADTPPDTPQVLRSSLARWTIIIAGVVMALLFAGAAAGQWDPFLRYIYRVPFDIVDPIFNRDIGFYMFELPIYEFIQGWLLSILFVTLLGLVPIYAINNLSDIQRGAWRPFSSPALRRHLLLVGAVFLIVWGVGYFFDIYRLLYSPRGVAFGASYTDMTASLWLLRIQLVLVLLTAAVMLLNIFRPSLRLLAITGGAWVITTLLLSSLLPAFLQRYVVEPNELTLEEPYIINNIEFTRQAFKLDEIQTEVFGEVADLSVDNLLENEESLRNIRLWDYRPLQQTYQQLQALRPYYEFGEVDIDRYTIDGEQRQVMLSARELNKDRLPAPSWVNRNLEFTHGYGIVMNPVNEVTPEGQPDFFIKDLPPQSNIELEVTQPEIYFGELTNDAVYVSSGREEFSYPSGDENVYTTYQGTGGVLLDSFLKRVAFAIRQSDANVLLTSDINDQTRIQFKRQIQERIRTLTPFLELDGDPYIVVHEGKLVWIQDAYTYSNDYPYSTPINVTVRPSVASTTPASANLPQPMRSVNYIRNAAKITIDAYNGDVNYYIADADDPIIQTYTGVYPDVFQPLEAMPAGLREHLRYPVDLFWVQARQYLTYHMEDVRVFYNKEDLWQIPNEIFDTVEQTIEPYFVTLALPGASDLEYLLVMPFTPATRNNMIGWMAARNDGENYGELIVYELPKQELVFGPMQIEGRIDQDPAISQQFSLWDQRGSRVIRGNLLVLPMNDSFLYIEPIYLLSDTNALPELRRVIAASNKGIAMEETLGEAIAALALTTVVDSEIETTDDGAEVTAPDDGTAAVPQPTPVPSALDATVEELVTSANERFEAAQEAQRNGDWTAYGQELEALQRDLEQLLRLSEQTP